MQKKSRGDITSDRQSALQARATHEHTGGAGACVTWRFHVTPRRPTVCRQRDHNHHGWTVESGNEATGTGSGAAACGGREDCGGGSDESDRRGRTAPAVVGASPQEQVGGGRGGRGEGWDRNRSEEELEGRGTGGRRNRWEDEQVGGGTGGRRNRWEEEQMGGGTGGRRNRWAEEQVGREIPGMRSMEDWVCIMTWIYLFCQLFTAQSTYWDDVFI